LLLCKERGSPRLSLQQVQLSLLSRFFICEPHICKAVPFAFLWPPHLCRCLVMSVKICFADGEELKCLKLPLRPSIPLRKRLHCKRNLLPRSPRTQLRRMSVSLNLKLVQRLGKLWSSRALA
jgi:hypothetical protein